ncbi:MAG: GNAT family N-acetyltransferase [Bacteroidota bacterium]|nr:GNAT family N-acetyltransferase [Bacteroidota bacterium]MDP4232045.1 GNAT family N-acetyltransferase [Bacteroidota bacterium]MDP4241248.1 GNAT family N-acetyltransferase [Bacteroidota bacterium]MDP4286640.1 GNAT family N-acetyltransferase [Bacteroidota bacterium]
MLRPMPAITIRPARKEDSARLAEFIHGLADFVGDECVVTPEAIERHLFSERPAAEALIAEYDSKPEGFALFFPTFSTFQGRPSLYLEDFFVNPKMRGKGVGLAMLVRLAQITQERGYCRLDWAVLDWNTRAADFYKRLGAEAIEEFTMYRLTEEALATLTA